MISIFLLAFTHLLHPGAGNFDSLDREALQARELADDEPEKKKKPPCWSFETRARYVSGFDHLVTIKNDCEQPARCTVSTDVNPKEQKVTVGAKSSETVLTYRGSPARVFVAKVECLVGP